MVITTILTFYALTADDLRILLTEKDADTTFNVICLFCVVVFSAEIALSCLGKTDYYFSFFFWLDIVSTGTLVLDLTWVAEAIQGGDMANARSGRTARVGARASRVVRMLKLVRLLKLYKAYYEAQQRRAEQARMKARGEEDDWDEADYEAVENAETKNNESRIGKKLSEMTTRKLIGLILAMLCVLPLLSVETANQTPFSVMYGADQVMQAFHAHLRLKTRETKLDYEKAMLMFVGYHNWFVTNEGAKHCPQNNCNRYLGSLFWVGIGGKSEESYEEAYKATQLSPDVVSEWINSEVLEKDGTVVYGTFPKNVQELMGKPWNERCVTRSGQVRKGFSLIGKLEHPKLEASCPEDLRMTEIQAAIPQTMTSDDQDNMYLVFYLDIRPYNQEISAYSLGTTFFVMVLLIFSSVMFTSTANRLVLTPVEKMIDRVEAIRDKPLLAMKMADDEFKAEEIKKARHERQRKIWRNRIMMDAAAICQSQDKEIMETVILEKTIIKLGSLLALGFGEAGADIIGKNMSGSDSAGVNAMVPGRRRECIVGILRVRDFSSATEVLQSKVMMFSNQLAEIVHGVCSEFGGAPNKNTGESFLVIWKLDEEHEQQMMPESGEVSHSARKMSEGSMIAAATIVGAVHRSPLLGSYREHPGLQNRLGSNCRVHLSCGLHKGWAIEGAVGSEFKIDCSYLSPNVSIATQVERATESYGVSVIVAQSVIEQVSQAMKLKCRLIDKVIIKGSPKPMELHCIDLDYMCLEIDRSERPKVNWNTRQRFKVRQFMEQEKQTLMNEDLSTFFDTDEVVADMRSRFTVEFFQLFNMGFQNYSEGEWQVAARMLSSKTLQNDGPSQALLRFMEVPHQFEPPKGWQGMRELYIQANV